MSLNEKFNRLIKEGEAYLTSRNLNGRERNQYLRIMIDSMVKILVSENVSARDVDHFQLKMRAVIPDDRVANPFLAISSSIPTRQDNLMLLQKLESCAVNLSARYCEVA